ncbi:MAG TPA: hypothetical protein VG488_05925 [Candidatus Angelobacter sp.]|jgi:hypothetical protein|nr:hypothetical protein [Candidatus Angelobacter sp.]
MEEHAIGPSSEKVCFVISPIGSPNSEVRERSDQLFRYIIKPAAEKHGLLPIRVDQEQRPGLITKDIIRHLLDDRIVIADLTDHNANVFYELAVRHACNKPTVQMILAGQNIPFDVAGMKTIYYGLDLESANDAQESLSKQIFAVLEPGFQVESPLGPFMTNINLGQSNHSDLLSLVVVISQDGIRISPCNR